MPVKCDLEHECRMEVKLKLKLELARRRINALELKAKLLTLVGVFSHA
jgi:hypothetical protein